MKVVIQCSASKDESAGTFGLNGRRVKFVGQPEFYHPSTADIPFRPDDVIPSTSSTWREHLLAYNLHGDNSDHLRRATDLYSPDIYRNLAGYAGRENVFILSAGWGLIKGEFLLPDYDITFSQQAERWKRRTKRYEFCDFAQLTQTDVSADEQVYFFGGNNYLPLFYRLTQTLVARKVIYSASEHIPREP